MGWRDHYKTQDFYHNNLSKTPQKISTILLKYNEKYDKKNEKIYKNVSIGKWSNFRVGFFCPYFCRMSGAMDGLVAKIWEGVSSEVFYGLAVRCGVKKANFEPLARSNMLKNDAFRS